MTAPPQIGLPGSCRGGPRGRRATGGRILASKQLVERLDRDAADALGLDRDAIIYTQLGDLPTATEKARRDAPSIAVCEL